MENLNTSNSSYSSHSDSDLEQLFLQNPKNKEIADEFFSRKKFKTPPEFNSPEEEAQFLTNLAKIT